MTTKTNSGTVSVSLELLPCPFCGQAARYVAADYVDNSGEPWPFAECDACSTGAPVEFWNKRAQPAGIEQAPPLEIPSRTITLSGCEFTEHELLARAVRAVSGSRRNTMPRWGLVRDAFGTGSGVATALCRRFGFDPDEVLKS